MIERDIEQVSLKNIDFVDETFRISVGEPTRLLRESIRTYGLLCPPILHDPRNGQNLTIVTGFRRLRIARELGLDHLPCIIVKGDMATEDLFMLGLNERVGKRELNAAERARAISKSVSILGEDNTIQRIMPLIGLQPSRKVFEQFLEISGLEENILLAVAKEKISVQAATELCKLTGSERQAVAEVLLNLGCSASIQKEIVVFCREIAAREKISVVEIFNTSEARAILDNPELNRREKTKLVRDYLKKRRYPLLTRREVEFEKNVRELKLPFGVTVKHPPYFEGDRWILEVTFRDKNDLERKLRKIDDLVETDRLTKLLKRY